jgi:crotonobetainyl-CoA:carnitine CoA-transferase CaiB-like acyl-CoA transferase
MVLGARDALADEHLRERGFVREALDGASGRKLALAAAPWRTSGLPVENARVAALGEHDGAPAPASAPPARVPPLAGLRVLELTRAWAGPFVGRFLGALGADVVKVEGARSPDGWRARLRMKYAGIEIPDGVDPATYTWDASALYNALNRNKRHLSLDLTRPDARELFLELAGVADLLIVNMTHRVLADFALEYDVLSARNPRLVLVNLPALGASGPYRAMPGYGILIEGMGGFAARYGARDEPARTTATYYPDPVAGIHATVAALAALAARERTGRGSQVDLSQQEAMWLQLGEGLALASLEGREIDRLDAEPGARARASSTARPGRSRPSVRNGPRRAVTDFRVSFPPELLALDPFERIVHPLTGERTYLRVPLRIDGAPLASARPAPLFDEHSDAVVAEWTGASEARIAELRAAGALGRRPGVVSAQEEEAR